MPLPLVAQVAVLLGTYVVGKKTINDGVTPAAAVLGAFKASNPLVGAAVGGLLGYTANKLASGDDAKDGVPSTQGMEAALTPWQGFARNIRMWGSGREAARINYGVGGSWGWTAYREDGFILRTGSARTQDEARRRADMALAGYRPRSTGVGGTPSAAVWRALDTATNLPGAEVRSGAEGKGPFTWIVEASHRRGSAVTAAEARGRARAAAREAGVQLGDWRVLATGEPSAIQQKYRNQDAARDDRYNDAEHRRLGNYITAVTL